MNYKYEWGKVCPRSVRPGPVRWESGTVKGHDEKVHVQCHHFAIGRMDGSGWDVRVYIICWNLNARQNSNTFLQNVRFLESHAQHILEHKRVCFWRSRYIYIYYTYSCICLFICWFNIFQHIPFVFFCILSHRRTWTQQPGQLPCRLSSWWKLAIPRSQGVPCFDSLSTSKSSNSGINAHDIRNHSKSWSSSLSLSLSPSCKGWMSKGGLKLRCRAWVKHFKDVRFKMFWIAVLLRPQDPYPCLLLPKKNSLRSISAVPSLGNQSIWHMSSCDISSTLYLQTVGRKWGYPWVPSGKLT